MPRTAVLFSFALLLLLVSSSAASPPDEEALAGFRRLFRSWHPVNTKIDVRDTGVYGLGVYAAAPLKKGDVILKVPAEWVVTRRSAVDTAESEAERAVYRTADSDNAALVAWLLFQRRKGAEGRWWAWVRVLPQRFDTPLTCHLDDVSRFQPPRLRSEVVRSRQAAEASYNSLVKLLPWSPSLAEWKWAKSVLSTRAWNLKGREHLVAVAGMFNHDLDEEDKVFDPRKATPGVRSQKFLDGHYFDGEGFAVVRSDRDAEEGEQVFESYGDNTNFIYFAFHGFVPSSNPYDCVELAFALPGPTPLRKAQRDLLSSLPAFPQRVCVYGGHLSPTLLLFSAVASVKSLGDKEAACFEQVKAATTTVADHKKLYKKLVKCLPGSNFKAEITALRHALKLLELELSGSFDSDAEDERLLKNSKTSAVVRVAVKYRQNQKRLLRESIEAGVKLVKEKESKRQENIAKKREKAERERLKKKAEEEEARMNAEDADEL